ncbi:hypothetical protein [Fimbriiglobus ruber]|uniref:hypothetical protein n=1 Tax=Fimbriiglobus ruber TaxID=1908690 RepID=UPI000B4AEDB3|nr:hypothetical protein [Fimbriiglobus ruber]
MAIEQAWLLKGWLLGQNAPKEITDAVEVLIGHFSHLKAELREEISTAWSATKSPQHIEPFIADEITAQPHNHQPTPKKKRNWSPESRAAQADRMRQRQAAGLMTRKTETATPGKAKAPSQDGA